MIFDIEKFIHEHKGIWKELEEMLYLIRERGLKAFDFDKINRFYSLYHHVASDLNRLQTFSSDSELIEYLEGLVSQAYAEIYSLQRKKWRIKVKGFFITTFPQVFKNHIKLFYLAVVVMFIGALFGGMAIMLDPSAKAILINYGPLKGSPYERVLKEERADSRVLENQKIIFSSYLITHNIRVALFTLVMGITFGLGTFLLLFYNGIILGAVIADYIRYSVGIFAAGWLLPHGAFEIWAILIAGQAGFVIAKSLLKSGKYSRLTQLARAGKEVLVLFIGLSTLLVWAGIVEAFFSQYHEPLIPYPFKISFGILELLVLFSYFWRIARREEGGVKEKVKNQEKEKPNDT